MNRRNGDEKDDGGVAAVAMPLKARGLRTRKRLLEAARRIFERDGFLAARVTDIADEAGVAHGSFYTYFGSKEEIFRELFLDVEATMLISSAASRDPDPWRSIEAANRRYLEVYRDNAALIANWEQVAAFDTDFSRLLRDWGYEKFVIRSERAIRRWQGEGLADPDVDPVYAAHALSHMVTRFAYVMFALKEPFEFETAVEELTRLWANAIGVQKPGRAAIRSDGAPADATRR